MHGITSADEFEVTGRVVASFVAGAKQGRIHGAGAYRVDPDAVCGDFHGQRFAEHDQTRLAGAVRRSVHQWSQSGPRRNIDDGPATGLSKLRQCLTTDQHRSCEIHRQCS